MKTSIGSAERAVIVGSAVNGVLGATLGALRTDTSEARK